MMSKGNQYTALKAKVATLHRRLKQEQIDHDIAQHQLSRSLKDGSALYKETQSLKASLLEAGDEIKAAHDERAAADKDRTRLNLVITEQSDMLQAERDKTKAATDELGLVKAQLEKAGQDRQRLAQQVGTLAGLITANAQVVQGMVRG